MASTPSGNWAAERVRSNFRLDVTSAVFAGALVAVLQAFMPVVVRRLGGSTFDVSLVVAAPFIGHLLNPFFAYLLASFPPVKVVAGSSTAARVVFVIGMLVAATPIALALTTVAFWVLTIANVAAYTTLMQAIYPDRERATAMGRVRTGFAIAGVVTTALTGALIDAVPATLVFAAIGLIAIPGQLIFFAIRHDGDTQPASRRAVPAIARDLWGDDRYRTLLLAFTVYGFGNLANLAVFPIMLVDKFNAPNGLVGALAATQSAAMIGAYWLWGRVIDRGSSLRWSLLNTAMGIALPLGFIVAPSAELLLPVYVIWGVVIAGGDITYHTNVVEIAPRGRIGEYAAAQSLLLGVRGTVAPFAASALLGFTDPRVVLLMGTAFMIAGTALFARALRPVRQWTQS